VSIKIVFIFYWFDNGEDRLNLQETYPYKITIGQMINRKLEDNKKRFKKFLTFLLFQNFCI
jgi:hypothetical protein